MRLLQPATLRARSRSDRTGPVALLLAALVFLLVLTASPVARADEGEESDQAKVLVLQATALAANEAGVERVSEKIDDALAAPDQEGVDAAKVRQALSVITSTGDNPSQGQARLAMTQAHRLLQESIGVTGPPAPNLATGDESGTTVVLDEFQPAKGISDGGDVALAVLALAALAAGLVLARRLRPEHSIRALQGKTHAKGA